MQCGPGNDAWVYERGLKQASQDEDPQQASDDWDHRIDVHSEVGTVQRKEKSSCKIQNLISLLFYMNFSASEVFFLCTIELKLCCSIIKDPIYD